MEYSLTKPNGQKLEFAKFIDLMQFLTKVGEVDGWILHIHHM